MTPLTDLGMRLACAQRLQADAAAQDRPTAPYQPRGPAQARATLDLDPEVIVFNLKRRYTGVSATVNTLVPVQLSQWRLGYCGEQLSNGLPGMSLSQAVNLSRKPPRDRVFRIWHVRRDHEMAAALFVRDVLRLPIRLVFTSAAQHRHGAFPRWLISRMDAVIATTHLAASFVPNTSAVVAHGIDLERFSDTPDKRTAWAASGLPGAYGIGVFGRIRPDLQSALLGVGQRAGGRNPSTRHSCTPCKPASRMPVCPIASAFSAKSRRTTFIAGTSAA